MPTELDTTFLGLLLDEELLNEEFDAIVRAGWSSSEDGPARRRTCRPRPPVVDRSRSGGHGGGRFDVMALHHSRTGGLAETLAAWGRGPPAIEPDESGPTRR